MEGKARQSSKAAISASFNRAEGDAKALARQQAAITRISQRALTGAGLSELFEEATAIVARTLRVKYCKVLELLPDGQSLLLQAGVGWKEGYVGRTRVNTESGSQAGYTLLCKRPVVTPDITKERRFKAPPLLVEHKVISGISVIIFGRERPFGILGAHSTRKRDYRRHEINFVQAVANILATAIERKRNEEVLKQHAQVLEQIHDSAISTDLDGVITSWNRGATRLFGYTSQEALGRHISFLYRENQRRFLEEEIIRPLKEKGVHKVKIEMRNKLGRKFHAHLSLSLLRDATGKPAGMIGYSMDISAQVRGRVRLEESEAKYRGLAESITEAFFVMDRDLRYTYWNRTAEKLTGLSAKAAIGNSLYDLFPNVRGTLAEKEYLEALRTQQPRSFENQYELHGHEHFFDINVYPSKHGLSVIAKDITQRKLAEEALRLRSEIIDQIHDSVVSTDLDGHVTSWNKGAERLFGYSAEETIGKHISFVYGEDQHSFLQEKIIAPLHKKGSHGTEVRMRKKSGEEFFAHLSTSLLRDSRGTVVGMIGYAMDITAQVRARERLRESEQRHRELAESITDVFVELDSDLRYTYWNRTAEKVTGISTKDAIGKSFYDLFPKARGTKIDKQYQETLRTYHRRSFESPFEIHGAEHVFDVTVYPSKQGLSVVAKDITERKRSEEAMVRQANLLEQSHDAIIVWEFPGTIIYWNRGAEQLYGFSREEAMGRRTNELLRTAHPMPTAAFEKLIERNGTWAGELTHLTRDGRKIRLESRQVLMREAEGRRLVLETNRDITERALAQQAARTQTEVLVEAMKSLTTGPELGRFLDKILLAINRELKAHSSTLWLYDPATKTFSHGRTAYHDQILKGNEPLSLPNTLTPPPLPPGTAADRSDREPFFYSTASHHNEAGPQVRAWMAAQRVKSMLYVPLLFGEERVGYLTIHDGWRESYTAQEKQLAQALANQVTLALVLARLTSREQQAAILEERNRMAREIHDTLAQNLVGIVLQLEVAENDLSANFEAVGPRIACAKALAREAHTEARRSIAALRSGALESGDLSSALRRLCDRTVAQAGTKVDFTLHGSPRPLPPDAENHLFRIGQEAFTNAVKHADANEIRISLQYEPEMVTLEVTDDGKGFSVKESQNQKRVGLSSMSERSKLIGGSLRIKSSVGSGTQVTARVPIPAVHSNRDITYSGKPNPSRMEMETMKQSQWKAGTD